MKAVIIGPGRIGCGFAGQLLDASGYEITFVARDRRLVEHFRRTGCYRVVLAGAGRQREIAVGGFETLPVSDGEAVAEAIARADVVATAVGPGNLPAVAPLIASGLARAAGNTNVIAFENLADAGPRLRSMVAENLPGGRRQSARFGFSGAVVSRMVAHRLGDLSGSEPLVFLGDPPEEFIVDGGALRAPAPSIRGMKTAPRYAPCVLRKLYMFSAGHATTAYLGSLKGYHYIHAAIRDPEIREAVLAAMREGQRGLAASFGAEFAGGEDDLHRIVERFENAALSDPIQRVGRDPRRKLGAEERLVGAAQMASRAGISPDNLGLATAAALCFSEGADSLPSHVKGCGVAPALQEICGLDASRDVGRLIANRWNELAPGWRKGNLLLSLSQRMWAWS
jgi:mannitol-1-phosphate 5-dehydrogenase